MSFYTEGEKLDCGFRRPAGRCTWCHHTGPGCPYAEPRQVTETIEIGDFENGEVNAFHFLRLLTDALVKVPASIRQDEVKLDFQSGGDGYNSSPDAHADIEWLRPEMNFEIQARLDQVAKEAGELPRKLREAEESRERALLSRLKQKYEP